MFFGKQIRVVGVLLLAGIVWGPGIEVEAQEVVYPRGLMRELQETHPKVLAAEADVEAHFRLGLAAYSQYFPKLHASAGVGNEWVRNKPAGTTPRTTNLFTHKLAVGFSQLLFDGTRTINDIKIARQQSEAARLRLEMVRQDVVLEGVVAYVRLWEAFRIMERTRAIRDRVREQFGLETIRLESGRGSRSDLLRARTQLVDAEEQLVREEKAFGNALAGYRVTFDSVPSPAAMKAIIEPDETFPNVDDGTAEAVKTDHALQIQQLQRTISELSASAGVSDEFIPRVRATADLENRRNVDGNEAVLTVFKGYVNMEFSLDTGSVERVRALRATVNHAISQETSARRNAVRRFLDRRAAYEEARRNEALARDQIAIDEERLKSALRENELGRNSKLDVMSRENTLERSRIEAIRSRNGKILAAYGLFRTLGKLHPRTVRSGTFAPN